MITNAISANVEAVVRHYEELDSFYREVWGEHIHHGLWWTGLESPERAVIQLAEHVAELAQIRPGAKVCDVGCGYGAAARLLANQYGAEVTALTVTPRQYQYACLMQPAASNPVYVLGDWMSNTLPDGFFDAVIAIESTEHMAPKARAFAQIARVLKPGGRHIVCAWLAGRRVRWWQRRHLLGPICAESRLPEMASEAEYRSLLEGAGLELDLFQDLSAQVSRTWSVCGGRLLRALWRQPAYRQFLLDRRRENRVFALTLVRIRLAYAVKAMRYGLFLTRRIGS